MAKQKVDPVKQYFDKMRDRLDDAKSIGELIVIISKMPALPRNLPNTNLFQHIFKTEYDNDLEKCREHAINVINGMQYKMYN